MVSVVGQETAEDDAIELRLRLLLQRCGQAAENGRLDRMREVFVADLQHCSLSSQYSTHGIVDKERGVLIYRKLLGENYYRLFFHWSADIRSLMYHIMLYQCRFWFEDS